MFVRIALHLLFNFLKLTGIDLKSLLGNVGPENKINAVGLETTGAPQSSSKVSISVCLSFLASSCFQSELAQTFRNKKPK